MNLMNLLGKAGMQVQKSRAACPPRGWQLGQTLIELMISLTLGLVVVGAILSVYLSSATSNRQNMAISRMNEDAAVAMDFMGNYLRMGGFSPPQVLVSSGSALSSGVSASVKDRNFSQLSIRACDNGFTDLTATFDLLACNPTAAPGKSAMALRFEGDLANTPGNGSNPGDCLANPVTSNTRAEWDGSLTYKLIDNRILISKSGTSSTLSCAGNGGSVPNTPQALIEGVESMFLSFGLADSADDKTVTSYLTQTELDKSSGTTADHWGRVVSVKVCLVFISQNAMPDGGSSYIDCNGVAQSSAGHFLRRSFSNTYTLRNRGSFV